LSFTSLSDVKGGDIWTSHSRSLPAAAGSLSLFRYLPGKKTAPKKVAAKKTAAKKTATKKAAPKKKK